MSMRREKMLQHIKDLAAMFLRDESDRSTLITVTSADISPDFKRATVFVSVYPHEKESAAISFLKRRRGDLREYVRSHAIMKQLPSFDFEIDKGEQNRQRIDEISL
jgi:ribosome-binding factor A